MKSALVIDTNPYLRDPEAIARAICRSVESSSAIEGIKVKVKKVGPGPYDLKSILQSPSQK